MVSMEKSKYKYWIVGFGLSDGEGVCITRLPASRNIRYFDGRRGDPYELEFRPRRTTRDDEESQEWESMYSYFQGDDFFQIEEVYGYSHDLETVEKVIRDEHGGEFIDEIANEDFDYLRDLSDYND